MTDAKLLKATVKATGEQGLRGLARNVLGVDERTVRRWREGGALPPLARKLCQLLVAHPELTDEVREDLC